MNIGKINISRVKQSISQGVLTLHICKNNMHIWNYQHMVLTNGGALCNFYVYIP